MYKPERTRLNYFRVVGTRARGKNYELELACGHKRLHTPGAAIPAKAHCPQCREVLSDAA